MARYHRSIAALALAACVAAVGPGCKKETTGGTPAANPAATATPAAAAAAAAFATALKTGDKAGLRQTTTGPDAPLKALEAAGDMAVASTAFRKAYTDKYGADDTLSKTLPDMAGAMTEGLDGAEFKVEGDTASQVAKPGKSGPPLKLKKEGGGWKVDLASLGIPADASKEIDQFTKMATALRETTPEITAGKHKTGQDAALAFQKRVAAALVPGK